MGLKLGPAKQGIPVSKYSSEDLVQKYQSGNAGKDRPKIRKELEKRGKFSLTQ